jgi:hypothetical protein
MEAAPPILGDPYLEWSRRTGFSGHAAATAIPLLLEARPELAAALGLGLAARYRHAGKTWPFGYCSAWASPSQLVAANTAVRGRLSMALPRAGFPATAKAAEVQEVSDAPLLIGVVDNHCGPLHRQWRRAASGAGALQSRLLALWDQGAAGPVASPWQIPADFGYGRELGRQAIERMLPAADSASAERRLYAALDYPRGSAALLADLHGHQVMDIAAGLSDKLAPPASLRPRQPDAASAADLVFVDLPQPDPWRDSTGAANDAFLLDALHYILARAGTQTRVVVNLSVGALAGPHDGSSLIERALDDLLAHEPRLAITLAAGNSALNDWHAAGRLAPGSEAWLGWRTMPGDETDSFMELWLRASADYPPAFRLRLSSPLGHLLEAAAGELAVWPPQGEPEFCIDLRQLGQRAMALVSLRPTAGSRAGQPAGLWRIEIVNGAHPLDVQAWLQRDTPGRNSVTPLQSSLEGVGGGLVLSGQLSTSNLAGSRRAVLVGAAQASDGQPSRYSPAGSPERPVDAYAWADESAGQPGMLCAGALSGESTRMSGTSASAPLVARALANHMAASPLPEQAQDWRARVAMLSPLRSGADKPLFSPDVATLSTATDALAAAS